MKNEGLTHDFAKDPGVSSFVNLDEDGGHADTKDEDVGQAQIEQEQVGRVAQVAIVPDDDGHQTVAHKSHHQNQTARQHHQQTDVSRKTLGFLRLDDVSQRIDAAASRRRHQQSRGRRQK